MPRLARRRYLVADIKESEKIYQETLLAGRQVFGSSHDQVKRMKKELEAIRRMRHGEASEPLERRPIVADAEPDVSQLSIADDAPPPIDDVDSS